MVFLETDCNLTKPRLIRKNRHGANTVDSHTPTARASAKPKSKTKRPDTDLAEALDKMLTGEDEVVIYKNGKKVGAIISARTYRFLLKATEDEMDRRDAEEADRAELEEGDITLEEMKKELGTA